MCIRDSYDISLVSGNGYFGLEPLNEDRSDFYENFSKSELKEYKNLLIEIGDKITVESGLEVSLVRVKPYVDKNKIGRASCRERV